MSPKSCSLAYDEIEAGESGSPEEELCFQPNLKVIVNKRKINGSSAEETIKIRGRIHVSF